MNNSSGWNVAALLLVISVMFFMGAEIIKMNKDLKAAVEKNVEDIVTYAEFEVLLGSNVGESIPGVLKIAEEDIPKFFDAHTWRLLPPPEEEVVE